MKLMYQLFVIKKLYKLLLKCLQTIYIQVLISLVVNYFIYCAIKLPFDVHVVSVCGQKVHYVEREWHPA